MMPRGEPIVPEAFDQVVRHDFEHSAGIGLLAVSLCKLTEENPIMTDFRYQLHHINLPAGWRFDEVGSFDCEQMYTEANRTIPIEHDLLQKEFNEETIDTEYPGQIIFYGEMNLPRAVEIRYQMLTSEGKVLVQHGVRWSGKRTGVFTESAGTCMSRHIHQKGSGKVKRERSYSQLSEDSLATIERIIGQSIAKWRREA